LLGRLQSPRLTDRQTDWFKDWPW